MLLRAEIEKTPELIELAKWWTDFQTVSNDARMQMIKGIKSSPASKRRTPRKRKKPTESSSNTTPDNSNFNSSGAE